MSKLNYTFLKVTLAGLFIYDVFESVQSTYFEVDWSLFVLNALRIMLWGKVVRFFDDKLR